MLRTHWLLNWQTSKLQLLCRCRGPLVVLLLSFNSASPTRGCPSSERAVLQFGGPLGFCTNNITSCLDWITVVYSTWGCPLRPSGNDWCKMWLVRFSQAVAVLFALVASLFLSLFQFKEMLLIFKSLHNLGPEYLPAHSTDTSHRYSLKQSCLYHWPSM